MKLSVETNETCVKFGDFKAMEMIKEAGFDAVDYSFSYDKDHAKILGENFREYAGKLREHMDKVGIICNQAHAPFRLTRDEIPDMSELHYAEIVRSIEAASILGAKYIIVHPIYIPVGETQNGITYEEYNRRYYKSLEPYCEKFGICIAVENMFYYDKKRQYRRGMLSTPDTLTNMVKSIDSPYFFACVDIGHLAVTGTEPEDFIKEMDAAVLKTLHVHDNDYIADRHYLPYTGMINWQAVMQALKEIEYEGDLTFEICTYLKNMPEELTMDALKFSAAVGRKLISVFNN